MKVAVRTTGPMDRRAALLALELIEEVEPDRKDRQDKYKPPVIPVLERDGR
jgi:hypothetical protein